MKQENANRQIIYVRPGELREHPANPRNFRRHTEAEHAGLRADIQANGIVDAVKACGDGCNHERGTMLDGHDRVVCATELGIDVPVIYLDGLSAEQEEEILLKANLAKGKGRKLSESERAEAEARLRELISPGQGARTDRQGGASGQSTIQRVGELQGETASAVKDRGTIFRSPFSVPSLREAVDAKLIARSNAATNVREVQRRVKANELTEDEGKLEIEAWVAHGGRGRTPGSRKQKNPTPAGAAQMAHLNTTRTAIPEASIATVAHATPNDTIEAAIETFMAAQAKLSLLAMDLMGERPRSPKAPQPVTEAYVESLGDYLERLNAWAEVRKMINPFQGAELRTKLFAVAPNKGLTP